MREYSKVSPSFWIGTTGRILQDKGPEAVIVGMYLISSPHSNMLGLYYCPVEYISSDTGLTKEGASKGLRRASQAGFCGYDYTSRMVWVYEMAKFQIEDSLQENDKRVFGVRKEYKNLPKNPFLGLFFDKYKDCFHLDERRGFEAPCKPLRSQEQEQEQEQEQPYCASENPEAPQAGAPFYLSAKKKKLSGHTLDGFERFWKAFDYPKSKAKAADAWLAVYKQDDIEAIIEGAKKEALERPGLIADGRTPIYPQGWLTGRRWEDYKDEFSGPHREIVLPEYIPPGGGVQ